MRPGKLPEPPLKRAVLGQLKKGTDNKDKNIGVGCDAGFGIYRGEPPGPEKERTEGPCLERTDNKKAEIELPLFTSDSVFRGAAPVEMFFGFHRGANSMLAAGGVPRWVTATLLLPEDFEEQDLRGMMARTDALCDSRDIEILGGQTETLPGLAEPVITFHFMGTKYRRDFPLQTEPGKVHPGDAIVMSGYPAGDLAGKWLTQEREILEKRFCPAFLAQAEENILGAAGREFANVAGKNDEGREAGFFSVEKAACLAMDLGVRSMHDIGEGGIFGALRELGVREGCGLAVDLKKIPIRQEVIELCEVFDRNPYLTRSCGALLMVTPDPDGLIRLLGEAGVSAAEIGRITDDKRMTVYHREELRYLDHPQMDECWRG